MKESPFVITMMEMGPGVVNLVVILLCKKIVQMMAYLFVEFKAVKKFVLLVSKITGISHVVAQVSICVFYFYKTHSF